MNYTRVGLNLMCHILNLLMLSQKRNYYFEKILYPMVNIQKYLNIKIILDLWPFMVVTHTHTHIVSPFRRFIKIMPPRIWNFPGQKQFFKMFVRFCMPHTQPQKKILFNIKIIIYWFKSIQSILSVIGFSSDFHHFRSCLTRVCVCVYVKSDQVGSEH